MILRAHDCREINRIRWSPDVQRFFEVYYLHFVDPGGRYTGWVRYVLFASGGRAPEVTIWAARFDADDPTRSVLVRRTFPLSEARIEKGTLGFGVGASGFTEREWWGSVASDAHTMEWELKLEEGEVSLLHLPESMYYGAFPPTKFLAPFFRARVSGVFTLDGHSYRVQGAPANSAHYWGERLAERRAWAICNAFREDPEFSFEGVSARPRMGSLLLPRITFLCFYWDGVMHTLNSPLQSLRNRSEHDLHRWRFEGRTNRWRFLGEATGRPERMLAHRYESPDGAIAAEQYIHIDFTGDMRVEIQERTHSGWRSIKTLTAAGTAAFETSQHSHDPRVAWVAK